MTSLVFCSSAMVNCYTDERDSQCNGNSVQMDSIASCCLGPGYFYSLEDGATGSCETCIGRV